MICKQESAPVSEAVVRSELPVFWWFAYAFVGVDLDREISPVYKCRFLYVALSLNVVALSVVKAFEGPIRGRQPADDLLFYANFFAPVAYLFIHSGLYSFAELRGVLQAGKAARQRSSSTRACCTSTTHRCTFNKISLCVDGLATIVILSLGLTFVLACDRAVKRNSGQNLDVAPLSLHPLSYLWIYVLQPAFWFPDIIAASMAGITQLAVTLLHAQQIDMVAHRIGELSATHGDQAEGKEGSGSTQPPFKIESIVPAKFMQEACIKHGRAEDGSAESAGTMSEPSLVHNPAIIGRGGSGGRSKQASAQAEVILFPIDADKRDVLDMCCLWIRALSLALQASARRYSVLAATIAVACSTLWVISLVAIFTSPDSQPIRFVFWPWAFSMPLPIFAAVGPAVYLNTLCLDSLVGKAYLWKGFGVPERMFLLSFITSAHYQPTYPLCGVVIDKTKFMAIFTGVAVPGVIAVCNAAVGPSFFLNIISVDPNSAPCTALRNITGTCTSS